MSLCHIPSASVDRSVFTCDAWRQQPVEWNNEAGFDPLAEAAPGWKVQPAFIQVRTPWPDRKVRSLEFECQASEDAAHWKFVGWPYSLSVSHPVALVSVGGWIGAQPADLFHSKHRLFSRETAVFKGSGHFFVSTSSR